MKGHLTVLTTVKPSKRYSYQAQKATSLKGSKKKKKKKDITKKTEVSKW